MSQPDYLFEYTINKPKLAEALYHSLHLDPFYRTMENSVEGGADEKKQAMYAYYDYSLWEGKNYGRYYWPEQTLYGASIWSIPLSEAEQNEKSRRKLEFIQKVMGSQSSKTYQAIGRFMSEKSAQVVPENAWYLSILAISPEYQGQGLGPGLLETTLSEIDAQNLPCYLETFNPRNLSFYQRLGFELVDSFAEPITQSNYALLLRRASEQ
ncbi:N-acetyltransferase [Aliikangiella sp. G2MR2-5]|uniref:GNAT family N-acetyltransferase n=1 Tax=Aliikangiella sp. G2MR2-5 TaxID=2788943 RepID=UPI0018A8F908|nr:GNAT family N-acetyltransferase [Aliikangiella sp. G2MR2-5]